MDKKPFAFQPDDSNCRDVYQFKHYDENLEKVLFKISNYNKLYPSKYHLEFDDIYFTNALLRNFNKKIGLIMKEVIVKGKYYLLYIMGILLLLYISIIVIYYLDLINIGAETDPNRHITDNIEQEYLLSDYTYKEELYKELKYVARI